MKIKIAIFAVAGLLVAASGLGFYLSREAEHRYFPVQRIAHGGGGFHGGSISNSLDTLEYNKNNFDFFEIDFEWTSDGELVCIHDWEQSAKKAFGQSFDQPPTLAEFEKMAGQNDKFQNCTARTLIAWLEANPGKKIVTDVKKDNLRALAYLAALYPSHATRIIPQIYHPDEYGPVRDMGYEDIIFTLYRFSRSHKKALAAVEGMNLYALTVSTKNVRPKIARKLKKTGLPYKFLKTDFPRKLSEMNIPTYVHTVNSQEEWEEYKNLGVSEIYTDWLVP